MTTEEWVAVNLAAAPPLSPEQIAILRPICQEMARHIKKAAPARPAGATHRNDSTTRERITSAIP